ncbi:MAG: hypothetical protein AAGL49_06400 [Pseudomonadota bacterium]
MTERGTYASLSAGLLARKGEATPAMESFGRHPAPKTSPAAVKPVQSGESGADAPSPSPKSVLAAAKPALFERIRRATKPDRADADASSPPPPPSAEPAPPAVKEELQAAQVDGLCAPECAAPDDGAGRPSGPRAAVTVRLQTSAFLRLKLASAQKQRTSQDLISAALDEYLDRLGVETSKNCACLRRAAEAEAAARASRS